MSASLRDYEVLGAVGSGTYGRCQRVRRKRDGKVLVWKEVGYGHMSGAQKQMLVSEVNLLRELRHPNIVRYYERLVDKAASTLYIVMEHCEGGDLATLIKSAKKEGCYIEEAFIWRVVEQVGLALHACHGRARNEKSILHRDLKPANIFLDAEHNVKLGDFGLARVLNSDASFADTFVGTPYYMSPEQVVHDQYDESCDIWSFGCVLYELASLRPPFTASTQHGLTAAICSGQVPRLPACYTHRLQSLISSMLTVNVEKRPSTGDILMYLRGTTPADQSLTRREEAVKLQEEAVKLREEAVEKREKELQAKEKVLRMREVHMAAKLTKMAAKKENEKENCSPSTPTGSSLKEANDLNNQLISALKRVAGVTITNARQRDNLLDQIRHLASVENQNWTKLDLIKQVCHHLANGSGSNQVGERLAKIMARSTELQRESLEVHMHNKRLLGI